MSDIFAPSETSKSAKKAKLCFVTMPSLSARFVRLYIEWIRRSKETYTDTEKMKQHIETIYVRPQSYLPPDNLGNDTKIERVDFNDWPLYRVSSTGAVPEESGAERSRPAMLYCHGGAFIHEIDPMHWKFIAQVSRETGLDVLVPIYPLGPRPGATAEQIIRGMTKILEHANQPVISIAGDSAGGTITLLTMQHLLKASPELAAGVRSVVLISPLLDCTGAHPEAKRMAHDDPWLGLEGLHVVADIFRGDLSTSDPRVSPLFGSLAGLPPILLLSGTHDLLCSDARRLSARFRNSRSEDADAIAAGSVDLENFTYIEQPEMIHVYPLTPSWEGDEARRVITKFVKRHAG